MDISKIDVNLASGEIDHEIKWINSLDDCFSLHGGFYDSNEKLYMRVPDQVCRESGNEALHILSRATSGGRLRFVTDSNFIAVKASLPAFAPAPHMPITLTHGFSVYVNGTFRNRYSATFKNILDAASYEPENRIYFAEKKKIADTKHLRLVEIYFPLYGGVSELYIGISSDAVVKTAPPYKNSVPMLFYGSSITQGACVSRPGNDYVSIVARNFNSDYINLGFSGSGNAEDAMIDYINSVDASVYAFDYNLYKDRKDRTLPSHFSIYKRIREKHPDSVILVYDKPGCDYEPYPEREKIIYETYKKALKLGDKRICYISARELLGEENRDNCMVDVSHPNDFGAMKMADSISSALKKFL